MTKLAMAKHCLRHREVDASHLDKIGEIIITDIGEENIYFISVLFGTSHFSKVNP
jgi:hypothetical protein